MTNELSDLICFPAQRVGEPATLQENGGHSSVPHAIEGKDDDEQSKGE
jgi:hypothetical protein